MKIEHQGHIYDIRTADEDPDYDNAPEINRMIEECGTIADLPHGQYAVSAIRIAEDR